MSRWSLVMLALCACSTPEESTVAEAPEAEAAPVEAEAPADEAEDYEKTRAVLAPSPLALEKQLQEANITADVATLVPSALPEPAPAEEKDAVAFQAGVVFAHMLLGGRTSEQALFLSQVKFVRAGMGAIGTGKGTLSSMDRAIEQIENETASREDFLKALDNKVNEMVPEEGWGPDDTVGPLVQAGAWLAGMNVVAKAVVESGNAEAADALLARGEVIDYFLRYVEGDEGEDKAGLLTPRVHKALTELEAISERETIGIEGAQEVATVTDSLLSAM